MVGPINKYLLANGSARPRILPRYYGLFPPPLWHHVLTSLTVVKAGRAEPRREKPAVEFIDPSYGGHRLWGRIAYGFHSNGYRRNGGIDETKQKHKLRPKPICFFVAQFFLRPNQKMQCTCLHNVCLRRCQYFAPAPLDTEVENAIHVPKPRPSHISAVQRKPTLYSRFVRCPAPALP